MVSGTLRALFSIEGVLTVLLIGGATIAGAHYLGYVDATELDPREEWTSAEAIEEEAPWMVQTQEGPFTDDLINGEVNDVRHEDGADTLGHLENIRYIARSENYDAPERGEGVRAVDSVHCRSNAAVVTTILEYESRHGPETGVEINANEHTVAEDAVERALSIPEQRSVLLDPGWSSHGVAVSVGDHGTVYVTQAFCGNGAVPED